MAADNQINGPGSRFGPIEMSGPGVDAWQALQDDNDSEAASKMQPVWESRSDVRQLNIERNKKFLQAIESRTD